MKSIYAHAFVYNAPVLVTAHATVNVVGGKGFGPYEYMLQVGNACYVLRGANPEVGDSTDDNGHAITLQGNATLTPITGIVAGATQNVYARIVWTRVDDKTFTVSGSYFASSDQAQNSDVLAQPFTVVGGTMVLS